MEWWSNGMHILILVIFMFIDSLKVSRDAAAPTYKYHHTKDGFRNENLAVRQPGFNTMFPFIARKLWDNLKENKFNLPYVENDGEIYKMNLTNPTLTWIGHSTLLLQFDGINFITDPVWSKRIGPVTPFDVPRLNKPGLEISKLPSIDFVIISHDHYDHLDKETVQILAKDTSTLFIVPLKVKEILSDWGVKNIVELDWWDSYEYKGLTIICTPAQHFSGRGLKRNNTLWTSFCVIGKSKRFYYGGDSGYWKHFKQIGEKYGPFDLAAIPIGAYIPQEIMRYMHLTPAQAVDAYTDLRAVRFVPIHYGTYPLSEEPFDEPPKLLLETVKKKKLKEENFWILKLGEVKEW
jgi:N-acyl-phosphatidylethanolamine-hydrolysing phospholipase D